MSVFCSLNVISCRIKVLRRCLASSSKNVNHVRMSKRKPLSGATAGACCADLTSAPLAEVQAVELAAVFKALGDPVRLRLLSMIASHPDDTMCVCELTPAFTLTQPTISHHLKLLRRARLIDCEPRRGRVYYSVLPQTIDRLAAVLTRNVDRRSAETAGT